MTSTATASIDLPATIDRVSAQALQADMLRSLDESHPIVLSGCNVSRIGQIGVQLLASAAFTARERNQTFTINDPSDDLKAALELVGLDGPVLYAR